MRYFNIQSKYDMPVVFLVIILSLEPYNLAFDFGFGMS